tara:strand:+ start:103 stop:399 length:297 start_codon:yes stop_codon:yes gene_type:complete
MKYYLIGLFVILILILFSYIFIGNKSIFTYLKLHKELNINKEIENTLNKKNKELKQNIKKLKEDTLDLDYLDEIAREKHNLSKEDEIIIFNNKEKKKE